MILKFLTCGRFVPNYVLLKIYKIIVSSQNFWHCILWFLKLEIYFFVVEIYYAKQCISFIQNFKKLLVRLKIFLFVKCLQVCLLLDLVITYHPDQWPFLFHLPTSFTWHTAGNFEVCQSCLLQINAILSSNLSSSQKGQLMKLGGELGWKYAKYKQAFY